MVRVRFAPSPTGSLHLGNALTLVCNRRFADERGGVLMLRIDDTDPARAVPGGEQAILDELAWLGIGYEEGPLRQSERSERYREAAEGLLASGRAFEEEGAVRFDSERRPTLLRPDGSATYHLASVVDDLDFAVTHVIRGKDHLPNTPLHQALARALGAEPPEFVQHGLILGEDGQKLSKRSGLSTLAELREAGIPPEAVRAYLDELGLPRGDVRFDQTRLRRLATDALAALSDEELARRVGVAAELAPVLRGARDLNEARSFAECVLEPLPAELLPAAMPTLERFSELRASLGERIDVEAARLLVQDLRASGADLRALMRALTGRDRGPELAAIAAALDQEEALRRVEAVHNG